MCRVGLELSSELVRISFQRNTVVAAPTQESADVTFGKARSAELPVLLNVNKFVEQQPL